MQTRWCCYARQLYRQVLLKARISYYTGILSACPSIRLSWCYDPVPNQAQVRWRHRVSPYDSLQLVSSEVIWCRWVRRLPSNEGIKEGIPLRNRNITTIGSSSVRTVEDRHRLPAYHNKHCWLAFRWYQHRWLWTTLNPKIGVFREFLAILGCDAHFAEIYWR